MKNSFSSLQASSVLQLPDVFFKEVQADSFPSPEVVVYNQSLADTYGLTSPNPSALAVFLAGMKVPVQLRPVALAYAGHQFGYFNMLGDGRAMLVGEFGSAPHKRAELQLKGSGQTPFSRRGDGKATLGSMLREYLMSEAMHSLGVSTTRSLSVVRTGESVYRRDISAGAVLGRMSASHLRVGTFEYAARFTTAKQQAALLKYTIDRLDPSLHDTNNPALALLRMVRDRQISLITDWMRVGFIHGVMNTDNMSIVGETIDYGPCAFMNAYNPQTVFSSIDTEGRYAFGNQPKIAGWNLAVFASTLLPHLADDQSSAIDLARSVLDPFETKFHEAWYNMMFRKLGILSAVESDKQLVDDLLALLIVQKADYTNTFASLSLNIDIHPSLMNSRKFLEWKTGWENRIAPTRLASLRLMSEVNPIYIPRNYLVEEAITNAENGDMHTFHELLTTLHAPYTTQQGLQTVPPEFDAGYQTYCGT